jgi:DNA-binding response OmpR family regulator
MKLNIVVVEDYDTLRRAICSELSQEGHSVTGLTMAEEIDDELLGTVPDLYIIDLNLPGEDGLNLVKRIRAAQPDVGIVIASARNTVVDRVDGYNGGANVFLTKPIDFEELKAIIQSIGLRLSFNKHRDDAVVELHFLTLRLVGPLAEVSLTQMEASVLAAFSRSPQRGLEHWQVAEHLGAGEDIAKDNVEVKLVRLRKKLAKSGIEGNTIISLRGQGYRLCVPINILLQ